jgi:hypothetical protein
MPGCYSDVEGSHPPCVEEACASSVIQDDLQGLGLVETSEEMHESIWAAGP